MEHPVNVPDTAVKWITPGCAPGCDVVGGEWSVRRGKGLERSFAVCVGRMDSKSRAGYLDDGRAHGDGEAHGVEG